MKQTFRLSTAFILLATSLAVSPVCAQNSRPVQNRNDHELPDIRQQRNQHDPMPGHGNAPEPQPPRPAMNQLDQMPPHLHQLIEELELARKSARDNGNAETEERLNKIIRDLQSQPEMPGMNDHPGANHQPPGRPDQNPDDGRGRGDRSSMRLVQGHQAMEKMIEIWERESAAIEMARQKPNANIESLNQKNDRLVEKRSELLNTFRENAPDTLRSLERAEQMLSRRSDSIMANRGLEHIRKFMTLLEDVPEQDEELYQKIKTLIETSPIPEQWKAMAGDRPPGPGNPDQNMDRIEREINALENRLNQLREEKQFLEENRATQLPMMPGDSPSTDY